MLATLNLDVLQRVSRQFNFIDIFSVATHRNTSLLTSVSRGTLQEDRCVQIVLVFLHVDNNKYHSGVN